MRIGLSSSTIEPNLNLGHMDGIGVYTQNLYQHYLALKNEVIPVVYPPFRTAWNGVTLPAGITFTLPCSISSLVSLTPLSTVFNNQIESQFEVFHATDHRIPKFKKTPVVATLHDAIMLKHPEWCNPKLRAFKNWLMKKTARWPDRYIAISKAMVPDLVEFWGVDEKKIDVVYNGVSDQWLEKISDVEINAVLNKYQLKKGFLLFVGTFQPRKNIDRIIEAYAQLPDATQKQHKLVLVGNDGWRSTELIDQIKRLCDKNVCAWLKNVSTDELRALYQSAKVFLFPSLSEGFGLPILEAFASGVPVITSTLTSMPEVAGGAAYLVDPFRVDEIRQGMIELLGDQAACDELIRKGSERVKAFSWKQCADQTLKIYQSLI